MSHMKGRTDCKMITKNLDVITFRSLHTHFQASVASLARKFISKLKGKMAEVKGTNYLPKSDSEVAMSETSQRIANSKRYCQNKRKSTKGGK